MSIPRNSVVSAERFRSLLDPITHEVMSDPVIASDDYTYDRTSITKWLQACAASGRPPTSPLTNQVLTSQRLIPNRQLRDLIDELKAMASHQTSERKSADSAKDDEGNGMHKDRKILLSSDVFEDMDALVNMDVMTKLNLRPPQIIVIGNESHGKSTLLERLIGFPIFPRDKGLCTRCPIRVHLRRNATAAIATVAIREHRPNGSFITSEKEPVALERLSELVRRKMNRILLPHEAVSANKELCIEIQVSFCLNIDIVDLPGLVAATNAHTKVTANLAEVTRELAASIVQQEKDRSLYLLVNDVKVSANTSLAANIVQSCELSGKTLGVLTKLDTFVTEDDGDAEECMESLVDGTSGGSIRLHPEGWLGCASRPEKLSVTQTETDRLMKMEEYEEKVLQASFPRLVHARKVGMPIIRLKVQRMYDSFLHKNWVPSIIEHLRQHFLALSDEHANLGLPMPQNADYLVLVNQLKEILPIAYPEYHSYSMLGFITRTSVTEILTQRATAVCSESSWMALHNSAVWNKITAFNASLSQRSSNWGSKLQLYNNQQVRVGASHSQGGLRTACVWVAAAVAVVLWAVVGLGLGLGLVAGVGVGLLLYGRVRVPPGSITLHQMRSAKAGATAAIFEHLEAIKSDLVDFGKGSATPSVSTKFMDTLLNLKSAELKIVKGATKFVPSSFANQAAVFKLHRFTNLMATHKSHIERCLTCLSELYLQRADALLSTIKENAHAAPLIETMFGRYRAGWHGDGNVFCRLSFSPQVIKLPHLLIDLWMETVFFAIPSMLSERNVFQNNDRTILEEACKNTRLNLLRQMLAAARALSMLRGLEAKIKQKAHL